MSNMSAIKIDGLWSSYHKGRWEDVLAQLDHEVSLSPAALILRAMAAIRTGDPEKAINSCDVVLEDEPDNPVAKLYRGLALIDAGRPAEAQKQFAAGPLLPQREWVSMVLERSWPEFLEKCNGELAAEPPTGEPNPRAASKFYKQATKHFFARRMEEAFRAMSEAYKADSADFEVRHGFAYLAVLNGYPRQALAALGDLDQSKESGDNMELPAPPDIVCRAMALHCTGRHVEALNLLSLGGPEGPDDWSGHLTAALCWLVLDEQGRFQASLKVVFESFFIDSWEGFLLPHLEWYLRGLAAGE